MENQELIEHEIEISQFITLNWKIPKKISVMEFKALSLQINQALKIQPPTIDARPYKQRGYKGRKDWDARFNKVQEYMDNNEVSFSKAYKKVTGKALAGTVYTKFREWEAKTQVTKEPEPMPVTKAKISPEEYRKRFEPVFSEDMVAFMRIHKDKDHVELAKLVNTKFGKKVNNKQVSDKIGYLRRKDRW